MIQASIRDERGELVPLSPNDPRYWEGRYVYQEYPKAVYRATVGDGYLTPESRAVKTADEEQRYLSDGWAASPDAARARADARDAEIATVAAERHHADARMSQTAQREALAADRDAFDMLPSVPETPIARSHKKKAE